MREVKIIFGTMIWVIGVLLFVFIPPVVHWSRYSYGSGFLEGAGLVLIFSVLLAKGQNARDKHSTI